MNISQIVGIHRNLVRPSQEVGYGNNTSTGNQQPRILFRVQKIGSHLASRLSEIRLSISPKKSSGRAISNSYSMIAQSLLNSTFNVNLYIGNTKWLGYNDANLYLTPKERKENHPSLFHNTCAYYFGFNDKLKALIKQDATNTFVNPDLILDTAFYSRCYDFADFALINGSSASENNSFDLVLPLPALSDAFLQDIPLHLLDKQDILIEIVLNLTDATALFRTGGDYDALQSGVSLRRAEFYQVSYTEPPQVLAQQRELNIPYTNIQEAVSPIGGLQNFQFSLARQKLKTLLLTLKTSQTEKLLGNTWSIFLDTNLNNLQLQVRYNDKLYFPEDLPLDTRSFSYKNDCSLFGQYCQPTASHDIRDKPLLNENPVLGCGALNLSDLLGGKYNNVLLPFSKVEMNSVLAGDLNNVGEIINDKPILITLKPVGSGQYPEGAILYVHSETQRVLTIRQNDIMVANA